MTDPRMMDRRVAHPRATDRRMTDRRTKPRRLQSAVRAIGRIAIILVVALALFAPWIAPHASSTRFPELLNAPPTRIHAAGVADTASGFFIRPWRRVSQLEQRYEPDMSREVQLSWLSGGRLVQSRDDARAPLLLLGADSFGRDVLSRLLYGGRVSLALALVAALGALLLGSIGGAIAGYFGGGSDRVIMGTSDFVLMLPAMYVALVLRSVLPMVLSPLEVFGLLAAIFAVVGAPLVARNIRAVIRRERALDYIVAAESLGASRVHVLTRHLLPAARGVIGPQLTLLVPGFIVSEATLSLVGFGFPDSTATWGTMLVEAASYRALTDFPWLLSPAIAMCLVVLALNLLTDRRELSR